MKQVRKLLALLLALTTLVSMLPVTALAAETGEPPKAEASVTEENDADGEETEKTEEPPKAEASVTEENDADGEETEKTEESPKAEVSVTEEEDSDIGEPGGRAAAPAAGAAGQTSGECGENLTWVFDEATGTLTISGNGKMDDFSWGHYSDGTDAPWCVSYSDQIRKVVIQEGVTYIGAYAFYECENLTSILIPDGVTGIGERAFFGCGLKSIAIPDSVTGIGVGAFIRCTNLTEITIPNGVAKVENATFSGCKGLSSIEIPNSVVSIGAEAFSDCENLTEISIPDGVTSIGEMAFVDCAKLPQITIPNGVTCIGRDTFLRCSSLKEIEIPDSVEKIEYGAFQGCTNLSGILIPSSVTSIARAGEDGGVFDGDEKLTISGYSYTAAEVYAEDNDIPFISLGEATRDPSGVCDENLTWLVNVKTGTLTISGNGEVKYDTSWRTFNSCIRKIVIEDGVTGIGDWAFVGCDQLSSVVIANSIESIGDCAFSDCNNLTEIKIPSSVKFFGENSVGYYCTDPAWRKYAIVNGFTISGYPDTAAETYAKENDITFVSLAGLPLAEVTLAATTYTYSGTAKEPAVTVKDEKGNVLTKNQDYTVSYQDNINAGTASVTVTGTGEYTGTITKTFTINKADQTLTASISKPSILAGATASITANGIGTLSYTSGNTAVATVNASGVVTGTGAGTAIITVTAAGDSNYNAASKTVSVAVSCAAPVLISAVNANGGVQITWNKVTGAVLYRVFRKTSGSGWTKVGDTAATSYIDKTAVSNTTYTYTVRCIVSDGTAFTSAYDTVGKTVAYLSAPTLGSIANVSGGVQITWGKVTGAAKYRVFRKTAGSNWQVLGDTTGLIYTDKTAASGTAYTYTVRCVSANGKTFTSAYDPAGKTITYLSAPVLGAVANVSGGVQITWGKVTGAVKYRVFRKTSSSGWAAVGDTTATSFIDKNAASGTAYTYTVRCVSADGKAFTSAYDPTGKSINYLAAPTLGSAVSVNGGVQITWSKVTGAAKYRVFRKTGSGNWTALGDTTATVYIDKTAKGGTAYTYTVRCVSADGKAFTSAYDPAGKSVTYLTLPVLGSVTNVNGGVQITWGKVTGAAKYRVFRKTGKSGWQTLGDTTGLTYTDRTAVSGTTYSYTVRCVSADGETFTSTYDPTGKSINYLAAPALSGAANVNGGVQISWGKVTGAEKYRVFRKTAGSNWQVLGDVTGTTYVDQTAKNNTTYTYTVRCVSADGKAFTSAYDTAGKTITYLAAPILGGIVGVNGGVQLTWAKVTGAAQYRVFRKTGNSGWQTLGDTAGLTYTDRTAVSGTTYSYTVRCVSSDGKTFTSGYDAAGKTITYVAAPVLSGIANVDGGVQITWGSVNGAAKYRVFRKWGSSGWVPVGDTTATSYIDQTAVSGTTYGYTVRCISADGKTFTSAYDPAGKTITYLAAPTLGGIASVNGGVQLAWAKVTGAAKYRVFRKTGNGGWQPLGDTTELTYTDQTAVGGKQYTYTVCCVSADGSTFTSAYDAAGKTITYLAVPVLGTLSNVYGGVQITWGNVAGAAKYRVFRKTESSSWVAVGDSTSNSYIDKTAVSGTTYTYTVRCVTADGKSFASAYDGTGKNIAYLAAPALDCVIKVSGGVQVAWAKVNGAAKYRVFRKTGSSNWVPVGDTTATCYVDKTAKSDTEYVYTVRCISADGKTFTSAYDAAGMAAEEADPIQLALSATATAKKTSQIVLVVDHNLTFWNKDANGIWKKSMDVYCGYGKNGLKQAASRSEGDKTTPIGSFPLTLAFGTGANPGTGMDYRRITKQSYWSAVRDNTYNTWVESATYVSGEHLADYYQYKYAIAIGFNIDPVVYGRGSGIFLHCKSTDHWYTAGCVSVEESDMLRLMCAMNNGAYIIIVPNTASISSY